MKRDEAAFAAVVDAYQGRLLRYVARLLANPSPAEDIVQRVFIKCAAHWKGPMEPSDDLSAWLYRLAHNEAIDYVRRERRRGFLHLRHAEEREASGETVAQPEVGGAAAPDDAARNAEAALQSLGDRERQLVTLKVYEEKSYREIALITGMSQSHVGVALHNAMKKLAALLAPDKGKEQP